VLLMLNIFFFPRYFPSTPSLTPAFGMVSKEAFKIHRDEEKQLESLELIITSLNEKIAPDKISKKIGKNYYPFS